MSDRCEKVAYHSREVAAEWLRFMIAKGKLRPRRDGRPLHPYRCHRCGQWHLGHKPDWRTLAQIREATR